MASSIGALRVCVAASITRQAVVRTLPALRHVSKVTHTGQEFEADDARNTRFVGKSKEVNPNWAEKLIDHVKPIVVHSRVVSCNGGGGALGHPKVYINVDPGTPIPCEYCGLRFVMEDDH